MFDWTLLLVDLCYVCVTVKVICDQVTSKSKGYGFVQFSSEKEATSALQKMDGEVLQNINLTFLTFGYGPLDGLNQLARLMKFYTFLKQSVYMCILWILELKYFFVIRFSC